MIADVARILLYKRAQMNRERLFLRTARSGATPRSKNWPLALAQLRPPWLDAPAPRVPERFSENSLA